MSENELSPSESLAIITDMIEKAKIRFQENGFIYLFWGILAFIASFLQFILLINKVYAYNYFPYFVMPLGFIFNFYYYGRISKAKSINIIGRLLKYSGIILGFNLMIVGFFFFNKAGLAFFPIMLLLLGIFCTIAGLAIKFNILFLGGLVVNALAYLCFFVELLYHPLILSIASIFGLILPGIILHLNFKKRNV